MTLLVIGVGVAVLAAAYVYLVRESLGPAGFGLAALRVGGLTLIVLLLVDLPWGTQASAGRAVVLLDRSLSMGAAGGRWTAARDSARRIAGPDGVLLAFGSSVGALTDTLAGDGASRLSEALAAARALGGPVHVVTDGELSDAALLDADALVGVSVTPFPRDTVPGAALVRAAVPAVTHRGDTIDVTVAVATWGRLAADSATIEVSVDGRRLMTRALPLPEPPAVVTRTLAVPTASLPLGEQVLEIRHRTAGDSVPDDDARLRVVSVTADPPITLVADPASPDARWVFETLADVSGLPTRGFARVADARWVDMATGDPVPYETIERSVRLAALVVSVGAELLPEAAQRSARWWWRQDADAVRGDWYLERDVPSSPLTGALARIAWDSLPPLSAMAAAPTDATVLLEAQLGRRGASVPVLVALERTGPRSLETVGTGVFRWGLRGGSGAEALRTLVSSGVDWLLRSNRSGAAPVLTATTAVTRGNPVSFRWHGPEAPDSLAITLVGADGTIDEVVRFGPNRVAELSLPVGVYRWQAPAVPAAGTTVVERYSDELVPGPVWTAPDGHGNGVVSTVAGRVRHRWWLFVLAVIVLATEWAWRQRRGLP